MRPHHWFAFLMLWPLACSSTSNQPAPTGAGGAGNHPGLTDASLHTDAVSDRSSAQCRWSAALDQSACAPSRAYVQCTVGGNSVSYPSTDPMSCPNCTGTCQDYCKDTEFSLSCPAPLHPDAAATMSDPWYGCSIGLVTPLGTIIWCCPCENSKGG
jgi:hypothetical protein